MSVWESIHAIKFKDDKVVPSESDFACVQCYASVTDFIIHLTNTRTVSSKYAASVASLSQRV